MDIRVRARLFARAIIISSAALIGVPLALADTALPAMPEAQSIDQFIEDMVERHGFASEPLRKLMSQAEIKETIVRIMDAPYEAKPWYQYRALFISEARINGGLKFWREHETVLAEVEKQYRVPAEIIVAIIGVETNYGSNVGSYRVLDALATLAFAYPKRSTYFRSELEQFLLMCRDENIDPSLPKGSYAGAMGLPQFMPSSFRHYAADFDGDHRRDIWSNYADAIASVANYFSIHGWQQGQQVVLPATVNGEDYQKAMGNGLNLSQSVKELHDLGIEAPGDSVAADALAMLVALEEPEKTAYWLGLRNFYVITRYNRSASYAMVVYQLSQEIRMRRFAHREVAARFVRPHGYE